MTDSTKAWSIHDDTYEASPQVSSWWHRFRRPQPPLIQPEDFYANIVAELEKVQTDQS